jgi:hypothetical protein
MTTHNHLARMQAAKLARRTEVFSRLRPSSHAAQSCGCSACFAVAQLAHDPGRADGSESGDEFRRPRSSQVAA